MTESRSGSKLRGSSFADAKPELFPVAGEWSFETRFDIIIRDACFEFSA